MLTSAEFRRISCKNVDMMEDYSNFEKLEELNLYRPSNSMGGWQGVIKAIFP